jgi:PAS domain S-box-containing protein
VPCLPTWPASKHKGVCMDLNRLVADAILAAADAVVATDRDEIIRVWNPGAERIFGHRADGALDQSLDLTAQSWAT